MREKLVKNEEFGCGRCVDFVVYMNDMKLNGVSAAFLPRVPIKSKDNREMLFVVELFDAKFISDALKLLHKENYVEVLAAIQHHRPSSEDYIVYAEKHCIWGKTKEVNAGSLTGADEGDYPSITFKVDEYKMFVDDEKVLSTVKRGRISWNIK